MQTNAKSVPKSSNDIDKETLQLIQENIATKLQKVHASLYNEHGSATVTINGKEHSLPTTKEYILKEYADVFTGIGTLPGTAYHIELKEDYNPV